MRCGNRASIIPAATTRLIQSQQRSAADLSPFERATLRRTTYVLFVLSVLASPLLADNWPEFRGPTAEGHATGPLPTDWGPDRNVAWKQTIPGKGWSSPIVYDG